MSETVVVIARLRLRMTAAAFNSLKLAAETLPQRRTDYAGRSLVDVTGPLSMAGGMVDFSLDGIRRLCAYEVNGESQTVPSFDHPLLTVDEAHATLDIRCLARGLTAEQKREISERSRAGRPRTHLEELRDRVALELENARAQERMTEEERARSLDLASISYPSACGYCDIEAELEKIDDDARRLAREEQRIITEFRERELMREKARELALEKQRELERERERLREREQSWERGRSR